MHTFVTKHKMLYVMKLNIYPCSLKCNHTFVTFRIYLHMNEYINIYSYLNI